MTNDERQTALIESIREHLQSIAIIAVQAQDAIGNYDKTSDNLDLIAHDLETCKARLNSLYMQDWGTK